MIISMPHFFRIFLGSAAGLLITTFQALAANTPPMIALLRPVGAASYSTAATIPIKVSANDTDGTLTKVDVYLGVTLVYSASATTSSLTYEITGSGFAPGTYTFTAKATDNLGAVTTSSPITITVYALSSTNVAPSVSLGLPVDGAAYQASAPIPILANPVDTDGTINRVELFGNGAYLGTITSPYQALWSTTVAGTYQITAVAYDNLGVATASGANTIIVFAPNSTNKAPTTSFAQPPSGGVYVAPATIPVSVNASDSDGTINRVDFYLNGNPAVTMTAAPYNFNFVAAAGSYAWNALAYDNLGVASSPTTSAIVVNAANTPPTISLAAPAAGALINQPANVTLSANTSAPELNDSVAKVEFFSGTTLIGTATSAPWSAVWANPASGTYAITAKATDGFGAATTTVPVSIVVNTPPVVSLSVPAALTGYEAPATIVLNTAASDPDGTVQKVEFYSGSTLLGTATAVPWNLTLNSVQQGNYSYIARAYDNRGAFTDSAPYPLAVASGSAPVIFNYDETGRLIGAQH